MISNIAQRMICITFLGVICSGAVAQSETGITVGNLTLRPSVDTSFTHDSNAGLAERAALVPTEESDVFFELQLGLALVTAKPEQVIVGNLQWYSRSYDKFDELNEDGLAETLTVLLGNRDGLEIRARQSFERVVDSSRQENASANPLNPVAQDTTSSDDISDLLKRDILSVNGVIGRHLTDKLDLDLGYAFGEINYESDNRFDSDQQRYLGEISYSVSDKSSGLIRGHYGVIDSDGNSEAADVYSLLLGIKSKGTEKLAYNTSFGYGSVEKKLGSLGGQQDMTGAVLRGDINESSLAYDVGVEWVATERLKVNVTARNGYTTSSFSPENIRETDVVQLRASHQSTEALTLGAAVSFRNEDFQEPVTRSTETSITLINEERDTIATSLVADFAPPAKWYRIYASTTYLDTQSNLPEQNFYRFRFTAGLELIY